VTSNSSVTGPSNRWRREPAACFQAFNNNHYVGMVVFIGLALDYLYRGS
jgi:4-hydroxybenzoate polyprenyltransferase